MFKRLNKVTQRGYENKILGNKTPWTISTFNAKIHNDRGPKNFMGYSFEIPFLQKVLHCSFVALFHGLGKSNNQTCPNQTKQSV